MFRTGFQYVCSVEYIGPVKGEKIVDQEGNFRIAENECECAEAQQQGDLIEGCAEFDGTDELQHDIS